MVQLDNAVELVEMIISQKHNTLVTRHYITKDVRLYIDITEIVAIK